MKEAKETKETKETKEINKNFKKLTPITNASIDIYKEALDFALNEEDLNNIALSGGYSSGKSSIIETYKTKKIEKKFINLNLSHFNLINQKSVENNDGVDSDIKFLTKGKEISINYKENNTDSIDLLIEKKLVNQLLNQLSEKKISETNFKYTIKKEIKINFYYILLIIIFLIIFYLILNL